MKSIDVLIIANFVVGVCFLVVPAATVWLYLHRHRDWPRSWVLLMVGGAMGMSGVSRLTHAITYLRWPHIDPAVMATTDSLTAIFGLFAACLVPWGVFEISKLPTPEQYEHTLRNALAKKQAQRESIASEEARKRAEEAREASDRRFSELTSILSRMNLPEEQLNRIVTLLREVR